MTININERRSHAENYFTSGYNCAQSVFLAFADLYDLDIEMAKKMAVSFGGGMGRMREVCGAVSGMAMVMGFQYPASNPEDKTAKTDNYAAVQRTAGCFKELFGTIICRELLDIKKQNELPTPSDRTPEYYAKRPCARFVGEAAEIVARELSNKRT